jgi:NodT family efflux transporter outer membrane factor (OMF) lipoprotein
MKPFASISPTQRQTSTALAAMVSCLLLVLPSCAIPKLQQGQGAPPVPDTFNGVITEQNSAQVGIDEFFNDPILTDLIRQALAGNQQLRILGQDIQIANFEIMRRRGAYLPFLSLGTFARLDKFSYNTLPGSDNLQNKPISAPAFPKPLPDFMVAGNVSWQIDIWRQLRNARDAAGLRYLATYEGRTYAVTRLVADVAENYYTLLALDARLENLNFIISLQEKSLETAVARKEFARDTELGVQRFQAEVRKNQSERYIVSQQIVETENQINFLLGRFPQRVERQAAQFYNLNLPLLYVGVPSHLLLNRPDIRQRERELQAAGLDVRVARANFFPKLIMSAGVGYEAFNTRYLFLTPESLIYNTAGNLVAPLVNFSAIRADYLTANARQLQALYEYQRTVINAFTEVTNRIAKVQNYSTSIDIKKQQLESLDTAVSVATNLFQAARPGVDYMDVLFAQRDLVDARMVVVETKREQLTAVVNAYQALGGGAGLVSLLGWDEYCPPEAQPCIHSWLPWFGKPEEVPPPAGQAPPPPVTNPLSPNGFPGPDAFAAPEPLPAPANQ